jgi:hypothetical protein
MKFFLKRLYFNYILFFCAFGLFGGNESHIFFNQSNSHNNNTYPYDDFFKINSEDLFKVNYSVHSLITNVSPSNIFNFSILNVHNDFSAYIFAQSSYGKTGKYELGTPFDKSGVVSRINKAIIGYQKPNFSIFFGRASPVWGMNKASSIILSGQSGGFDHFLTNIIGDKVSLQMLHGQLNSEFTTDGVRIARNIAGHKFNWQINSYSFLSIGETVIYAGENRGIELVYLNPFVPYFFSALEGQQKNRFADNTNSMIFFYGRTIIKNEIEIFFELIIDDYQIDKTNVPNSIGTKIGLQKNFKYANFPFELIISNTNIDSRVYLHRSNYTSWNYFSHSLGDPFGPDQHTNKIILNTKSDKIYNVHLDIAAVHKGNQFFDDKSGVFNGSETIITSKKYLFGNLNISLHHKSLMLRIGWHNKPFPLELSNGQKYISNHSNGTYYLSINFRK